jgi:hypothetical protein
LLGLGQVAIERIPLAAKQSSLLVIVVSEEQASVARKN